MTQFQLIAFDLDDTLVDTGSVSIPNAVEMVNVEFGVPIKVEDWYKEGGYMGKAGQGLLDAIEADYGIAIPFEPFMELRKEYLHKQLQKGLFPAPGVPEVLQTLYKQGRTVCVCTNSVPERAEISLKTAVIPEGSISLPEIFREHVYSSLPTMRAKPAPDVYQHAARVLEVDPADSLAVEDTPTGVAAAVAAGYTAIGYTGLAHSPSQAEELTAAGAAMVIKHWDEFLPLLEKLEG